PDSLQLLATHRKQVRPFDKDAAAGVARGRRPQQAEHRHRGHGLSRAGFTHDRDYVAPLDGKCYTLDHLVRSEGSVEPQFEIGDTQDRRARFVSGGRRWHFDKTASDLQRDLPGHTRYPGFAAVFRDCGILLTVDIRLDLGFSRKE